ncbi:type IIL restriction-modification enzyme MmeI [Chromatium okenii]|jgi:hypothetical protein|uniref:type IIL restriction-modification enzyme MmeI n=1 Tax=Chromatium okenii TaxID=61644 RepID=UPI0034E95C10
MSLAALYDPLTIPNELVKAHHQLDATYSNQNFTGDADRVTQIKSLWLNKRFN